MNYVFTACFLILLISCNSNSNPKQEITKPVEDIAATKDQRERRARSEAYCKMHNIPVYENQTALFVDPEKQVNLRTKDEVVDRALALWYVGLKSEGVPKSQLDKIDRDYKISAFLSPNEKLFASALKPTEQQNIDASWRYEGLHVMLWALGFIDSLNYPDRMCDVPADLNIMASHSAEQFRQRARLRSKKEILDQADLILRLHWACVDARVNQKPMPGNLDASVVYERHYALNWLIRLMDQEWDDVTTDT